MKYIALILLVLTAFVAASCTVETAPEQAPMPTEEYLEPRVTPSGYVFQVVLESAQLMPADIEIQAGDSVEWVNNDFREADEDYESRRRITEQKYPETGIYHTLTFDNGLIDVDLPPGATFMHTFTQKGQFTYFDQYEPAIQGSVIVR